MSYLSRELANVVRLDRMTEVALDFDQERRDRRDEKADRCWNCGGSGVRCCEFARGRSDEEIKADLFPRTGNVTPAPVNPPDVAA